MWEGERTRNTVCVCVWEREGGRETKKRERESDGCVFCSNPPPIEFLVTCSGDAKAIPRKHRSTLHILIY